MAAPAVQPVALPALPRFGDWVRAALAAGVVLGTVEVALLQRPGAPLPPGLGVGVLAADAALVALPALALAAVAALASRRPSRSAMVGALVAPLLLAPTLAGVAAEIAGPGLPPGVPLRAGLALAAALAAAAGALAAGVGARLERAGVALSGTGVWAAVALALVGAELAGASVKLRPLAWGGTAVAAGLAGAALALRHRRRRLPARPGSQLAVAVAVGLAVAVGPQLWPWLLLDRDLPPLPEGPPNLLLLGFGPEAAEDAGWALLGASGVSYDRVLALGALGGPSALLERPGPEPVLAALRRRGLAAAAVLRDPEATPPPGAERVDRRPGPARLLRERGPRMAGPRLLLALAPGLRGPAAEVRSPGRLRGDARHWLLHWRTRRAGVPFVLLVDYRPPHGAASEVPSATAEIVRWLDELADLDLQRRTVVAAALEPSGGPSGRLLRVRVAAPQLPPRLAGTRVVVPVPASDLARALERALAGGPLDLPGTPQRSAADATPILPSGAGPEASP